MGFFQEMSQKSQSGAFGQNGLSICSRSLFLSGRMLFLMMKQGRASDGIFRVFRKNRTRFEKHAKMSSDKRSLMFCSVIQHIVQIRVLLKVWAILKQSLRKQAVVWENFEEVSEIRHKIAAEVVRNMYDNYTNLLLDVKRT